MLFRSRISAVTEERRLNLVRKELAWLRRGPPARTSKPKFRIDAANALIADEPPARDRLELQRFATSRLGKDVFDLKHVSLSVPGRTLLRDLSWSIGPGARIGLIGVNGSGKTSLLRLLIGETTPDAGTVPAAPVMGAIGALAFAANLGVAALLYRWREGDSNMRSVWICTRNDAIGNLAVLAAAAGVLGSGTGWPDYIVAAIMSGLALAGAFQVTRQALAELAPTRSAAPAE